MNDPDFIVSELLSELKEENVRKDKQIASLHQAIKATVITAVSTILLVVAGFLLYLNQYDFVSTTTKSAEGVYAVVDSNGNVVGQDLTAEQIESILGSASDG